MRAVARNGVGIKKAMSRSLFAATAKAAVRPLGNAVAQHFAGQSLLAKDINKKSKAR